MMHGMEWIRSQDGNVVSEHSYGVTISMMLQIIVSLHYTL